MTQAERRLFLIRSLMNEKKRNMPILASRGMPTGSGSSCAG